jgi:DNA-binding CsgD family transcriptional regulator
MPISWGLRRCHDVRVRGVEDAVARLVGLEGRPLEAAEFSHEVDLALRRMLSYDGWCLFGSDPRTGLRTVQFGGRGTERTAEMARNEAVMRDVNRYEDLAAAACPAGRLSAEHPDAARSFRLHEILLPQGFHSEIRLALRDRGGRWGALVLFREDPRRLFDHGDTAAVCAVADALTDALRGFQMRPATVRRAELGSGVVALAPDDRIVAVSGDAQAWLDDLVPGGEDETYPSDVTRVLFEAAHAVRQGDEARASTCVRTVGGRWLRVEGMQLDLGGADVGVVLQPATVEQLLGTVAAYRGLTRRELEVLGLVTAGLAGKHVARELGISLLTVNGHLRSVYRKCRVSGRDELVGRLL